MARSSDREEGEISDDENAIILRIKEYETTNRELEQIAQINCYSPYKRLKRKSNIISDLSSISSEELIPIISKKRRRTIKGKRKNKKAINFRHASRSQFNTCINQDFENVYRQPPVASASFYERAFYDCDSNSKSLIPVCEISDDESDNENESCNAVVNREELRLALTHGFAASEGSRVTLKERLQQEKCVNSTQTSCEVNAGELRVSGKDEDFDDDSLEESELRLIALKSAIIRKHLARKKRNAESAYSPTDFDATLVSSNVVEENEVEEIPICSMETSPRSSPSSNMSLSMTASFADNKTVDMDLESSDSDIEMVVYGGDNEKSSNPCDLVNMVDSLNSALHHYEERYEQTTGVHVPIDFPSSLPYTSNYNEGEGPPPPPPFLMSNAFSAFNTENINHLVVNRDNTHLSNSSSHVQNLQGNLNAPFNIDNAVNEAKSKLPVEASLNEIDSKIGDGNNEEEEEEALRSLLLSKLGTPNCRRNCVRLESTDSLLQPALSATPPVVPPPLRVEQEHFESNACIIPLVDMGSNDYNESTKCQNPEMILKKAVQRFNTNSTRIFESSLHSDIENNRFNGQLQVPIPTEYENDDEYSNLETRCGSMALSASDAKTENCNISSSSSNNSDCSSNVPAMSELQNEQCSLNDLKKTKENALHYQTFNKKPPTPPLIVEQENSAVTPMSNYSFEKENKNANSIFENSNTSTLFHKKCKNKLLNHHKKKNIGVPRSKSVDEINQLQQQQHNDAMKVPTTSRDDSSTISNSNEISSNLRTKHILSKSLASTSSPASPVPLPIAGKTATINTSRLITSVNLPDLKVKKLVIRVNVSDSEEELTSVSSVPPIINTVNADEDNANTASCGMSNTNFENRIDMFLRNMRLNTSSATTVHKPIARKEEVESVTFMTPQAVKHLPKAAQDEYLRLVNRMNLLQQKKQLKLNKTKEEFSETSSHSKCSKPLNEDIVTNKAIKETTVADAATVDQSESTLNLLRKLSVHIIARLDKSLQLVENARSVKIAKLHSEQRLKKLMAELEVEQQLFRIEQQKMQKLSPAITVANNEITSLKQKRLRLLQLTKNLGSSVRGTEYRSTNNEFKHEISLKSKQLASRIKIVNAIKLKNLEEFSSLTTRTPDNAKNNMEHIKPQILPMTSQHKQQQQQPCQTMNVQKKCNSLPAIVMVDGADNDASTVHPTAETSQPTTTTVVYNANKESSGDGTRQLVKVTATALQDSEVVTHDVNESDEVVVVVPCTKEEKPSLQAYISPLGQYAISERNLNGIVCPYELMGECKDNDCTYVHLDEVARKQQMVPP